MATMLAHISIFLLAILGAVNADWLSFHDCLADVQYISANNGNCVLNITSSVPAWTLYTCNNAALTAKQFSCSDSGCNNCELTYTYTLGQCVLNSQFASVVYQCTPQEPDYEQVFGSGYAIQKTFVRQDPNSMVLSTYAMATACRNDINTHCTDTMVFSSHYYRPTCIHNAWRKDEYQIGSWSGNSIWLPCKN